MAREFRKWLFKDVLPSVRRDGVYYIDGKTLHNKRLINVEDYDDQQQKINEQLQQIQQQIQQQQQQQAPQQIININTQNNDSHNNNNNQIEIHQINLNQDQQQIIKDVIFEMLKKRKYDMKKRTFDNCTTFEDALNQIIQFRKMKKTEI